MNTAKNASFTTLIPVLFGFFVMGFVDVVGIATNYVKKDFALSDTMANLLPMAVFLWFLIFSIPVGVLMNKIGRKKTVLLSMVATALALLIPVLTYNLPMVLITFALLGIGNTIIQVSLNPLLANIVSGNKLTSSLTFGQFIKALASFLGPIITAFVATRYNNWLLLFPIFGGVTLLSLGWLYSTTIEEERSIEKTSSFGECFSLLSNQTILLCFIGILTLVGIDVGINITAPKIMMERTGISLDDAGYATSLYFVFRTIGTFLGAVVLAKFSAKKFYIVGTIGAIIAFIGLTFSHSTELLYLFIALAGFACANIFSIIFSYALQLDPSKSNEISGLMVMGVSGGALFPFIMGVSSDATKGQIGAIFVLLACCAYQLFLSVKMKEVAV